MEPTLEERVRLLEARLARARRTSLAAAALLVAGIAASMLAPAPQVVRAERFEVVGPGGSLRALLGLAPVEVLSAEGVTRAQVPSLLLLGEDGEPRLAARVGGTDLPSLYLHDAQGRHAALLDFHRGSPGLELAAYPGQSAAEGPPEVATARLGVQEDGHPFLLLDGGPGGASAQLGANAEEALLGFQHRGATSRSRELGLGRGGAIERVD